MLEINVHHFFHPPETTMATRDDVNAAADALLAKIEEGNAKTDALIVVATACHDALVALRNAGGATPAELDAVVNKLTAGMQSIDTQGGETDAAAAGVAP